MTPSESVYFANVILPIPLRKTFTYRIPDDLLSEVTPGKRVIVQFGPRRYYSAIVYEIHENCPQDYEVKDIVSVLDDVPIVNQLQLDFWNWISQYYMCSMGEVMKAALPSGLKLESQTKVYANPDFETTQTLSASELFILDLVNQKKSIEINEIAKFYKKKDLLKVIGNLVDINALQTEEQLKETYKPRTETFIELAPTLRNDDALKTIFDDLKRAPKQLQLLMKYIQASGVLTPHFTEISKKSLLAVSVSTPEVLNILIRKGIFISIEKSKIASPENVDGKIKLLSDLQQRIFEQTKLLFEEKLVVLLHGFTASGKTEVYIHLIDEQLKAGKQVLYLLPEIALTTQIINRLRSAFGSTTGIYHSKFSDTERVQVWNKLLNPNDVGSYQLILGVRSSVFLPFSNLGLVIVDEEHENSYKQFDPAPRYHARDAAIFLAQKHGAKVLLGTATPSVESYYNAENGKYGLVKLFQRYSNIALPEISIANTMDARERKQMKSHFHPLLLESIKTALDSGEQVILFQNRRGFSPYMQCTTCQSIAKCNYCDVSLTYHKSVNLLVCHYCGYTSSKINQCKGCGANTMTMHGFGTEKIEDELSIFFPGRRIARMDVDTTRTRKAYEKIIYDFENGEIDILVGTQMLSKGLDFDNVSLVGILDADHLLNFPDFRAYERSFQLMSQVSGRAGRKNKQGKVVIQTSDSKNYIIKDVIQNDFIHTFRTQVNERYHFGYPPFTRLIRLTLKHKDKSLLDRAADSFAESLKSYFENRIIGPEYPLINRVNNWFQKTILIKIDRQASMSEAKDEILKHMQSLSESENYRSVYVQPDVDPM